MTSNFTKTLFFAQVILHVFIKVDHITTWSKGPGGSMS